MENFFFLLLILLALIFILFLGFLLGKKFQKVKSAQDWEELRLLEREDAIKRSRSVLTGQFSEQLAPYLPNFPGNPSECRFIGKPVDFLLLKGLDEKEIEEVVFVEVKTGKSQLSPIERSLKKAIEEGRVSYKLYRVEHKN
jgi:predicted Holliday junction resolvase-like endonuclease